MKSKGTRDVSPDMIKELGQKDSFLPFVEFVKNNKELELALCFRGNDSEKGKIVIYRHNHMIWELSISRGVPKVSVSMDHARFMYDWIDYAVKGLMDLGFCGPNKENYETINEKNEFAVRHWSKDNGYTYSAINLVFFPKVSKNPIEVVVKKSYEILANMQDVFFCTDGEVFRKINAKSEKYKNECRPVNYIKDYYFDKHTNALKDDDNHKVYSNFQKCREKHVQQDLFLCNHVFENGLFIYDLEFAQPSIKGVKVKGKNKPDMFGIRFDSNGNMAAICMIEVKSTKSALSQNSGLKEHLKGMESYISMRSDNGYLMDDRKREACRILNQYNELGLYGVKKQYKEDDFINLKNEIIFVLSDEVRDLNTRVKDMDTGKYNTINDILVNYKPYEGLLSGSDTGEIVVLRKQYD